MSSCILPTGEKDKARQDMVVGLIEKSLCESLSTFDFNFDGKILLDFGCGVGAMRNTLKKMYPGVIYVGLDKDPSSYESCQKHYPHDKFVLSDENSDIISIADVVFMRALVMHQDKPSEFLEKITNKMKSHSVLIIFEPTAEIEKATCLPMCKLFELRLKLGECDKHDWNGAKNIARTLSEITKKFNEISEDIIEINDVPLGSIREFNMETLKIMATNMPELTDEIAECTQKLSEENHKSLQYFGTHYLIVCK
jgi:2-polyprenyl-3-methyl-5-hydroxy-6-metoxy-1,4-benzoquinol methylase